MKRLLESMPSGVRVNGVAVVSALALGWAAIALVGEVPSLLSRGASLVEHIDTITRDGLVLAPETVAAIGRAEARRNRWTVIALWAIAALLAVLIISVW